MTTHTLIGRICDRDGYYRQIDGWGDKHYYRLRPEDYVAHQTDIPLMYDHTDIVLGRALYLERTHENGLMVVATIDMSMVPGDDLDGDWFLSPGLRAYEDERGHDHAARIRELSVTQAPAYYGQSTPVRLTNIDLRTSNGDTISRLPLSWYDVCHRAHAALRDYREPHRHDRGLRIVDVDLEELMARSRANNAAKPKPTTRSTPAVSVPSSCGEVLPAGVHRRQVGQLISWEGRPV